MVFKIEDIEKKFSNPLPKIYRKFVLKYPDGIYKINGKPINVITRKWSQKLSGYTSEPQILRCLFGIGTNDNIGDWTDFMRGKYLPNPITGKNRELVGPGYVPIGQFWNGDILLIDLNSKTAGYVYLYDMKYWGGPGTRLKKEYLVPQAVNFGMFIKNIIEE